MDSSDYDKFETITAAGPLAAERIALLRSHWDRHQSPPELTDLLRDVPPAERRRVLIELVKVDMHERRSRPGLSQPLEFYLQHFAELCDARGPVCELLAADVRLRRMAGEVVQLEPYFQRYPALADELRQMVSTESQYATQTVGGGLGPSLPLENERIDDFDLLTLLGEGSFARVFLARQRSMGRIVALKVSATGNQEPQTLAQLDHPFIVRVFDQRLLPERQVRLLYMQYVPGGTLEHVVERLRALPQLPESGRFLLDVIDARLRLRGEEPPVESGFRERLSRMTWPEAVCWIGARLAEALDYAHRRGVLHRDLKPANVLMAADGTPKLADFNVSFCSTLEEADAARNFGGSLAYMSPEQLEACNPSHARRPEDLDGRSDLYSLAVLLWELLTGRRPFDDEPPTESRPHLFANMLEKRESGVSPTAITRLPAKLPGLKTVLLKCLSPDPQQRYASGKVLARQLELCLDARAESLVRPREGGLIARMRKYPVATFLAAGILPNVVFCILNIGYNQGQIMRQLAAVPEYGDRVWRIFNQQMLIINAVAYATGIIVLLRLAWPVLWAVKRSNVEHTEERPIWLRLRALHLGDWVAWTVASLWFISGFVFPFWLSLDHIDLSQKQYVHFITSQLLCGLMSAMMAYFLEALLSVKVCCPALLDLDAISDEPTRQGLTHLVRRTTVYNWIAFAVFPLSLVGMVLIEMTDGSTTFIVLAIVSLASSALAMVAARSIQGDCEALRRLLEPGAAGR